MVRAKRLASFPRNLRSQSTSALSPAGFKGGKSAGMAGVGDIGSSKAERGLKSTSKMGGPKKKDRDGRPRIGSFGNGHKQG